MHPEHIMYVMPFFFFVTVLEKLPEQLGWAQPGVMNAERVNKLNKIAGPTGLWPDSLLRVQILPYKIFNDPKICWRMASF